MVILGQSQFFLQKDEVSAGNMVTSQLRSIILSPMSDRNREVPLYLFCSKCFQMPGCVSPDLCWGSMIRRQ